MLELQCQQKYSMSSTYSYTKEMQNTILSKVPSSVKSKCSIKKIIRSICNLIKINPFQCCLLAWLSGKSKYDIDKITTDSRVGIASKIVEDQFEMKVFVFILMNGYYVKQFLNERIQPEIQNQIIKQVPNFKYLYTKKFNPEKSLKTLSLSDINKIFSEWSCKENKKNKIDYNNLVDKILYLSKSYNVSNHDEGREEKIGQPKKKRKIQAHSHSIDENQNEDDQSRQIENELIEEKLRGDDHHSEHAMNMSIQDIKKFNMFRFNNSPDVGDFFGPSQEGIPPSFKKQEGNQMVQSRRTTRNMLQTIRVCDFISSQDNLFNSQVSSVQNLMGSQHSVRSLRSSKQQINEYNIGFFKKKNDYQAQKIPENLIKKTDSFDA